MLGFTSFDLWRVLTGVAIFLLGNNYLEESLKSLVGRRSKLLLKKYASRKLSAVSGGVIITGILQSSSIVNMMLLAFVGAGILSMQNALAVTLGANLGSTIYNWIVALIGFKLSIESFAYPIAGIAGILLVSLNKEKALYQWSKFLFGFSFLFVGLDFIRLGIEAYVAHTNFAMLAGYPSIVFVLAGFVITALLQSSSVTIAILLSAMYVKAISLYSAMAIVLGSEVGTTLKLILVSITGTPAKKRLALGNFLINFINTIFIFCLLTPIYRFITNTVTISNNLIALVFFQSLINFISILIFMPFLKQFGKFLENRFINIEHQVKFIDKVSEKEPDLALDALEREIARFLQLVIAFCRNEFQINSANEIFEQKEKDFHERSGMEMYNYIKELHGNMHAFFIRLQGNILSEDTTLQLEMYMSALRNGMYATKSMKDSHHDIEQLRNSSNDIKYEFYVETQKKIAVFLTDIDKLLSNQNKTAYLEQLTNIYNNVQNGYSQTLQKLYKEVSYIHLDEMELSTLINFNREIFTFLNALLNSIKDYLLDGNDAAGFDSFNEFRKY